MYFILYSFKLPSSLYMFIPRYIEPFANFEFLVWLWWKIRLNNSIKYQFLRKFCFWNGKCHNSIVILKLLLLKNQINSENFKYCKDWRVIELRRMSWGQWKAWICKRQIPPQVKEKIVLDYYNHFGKFLLTFALNALRLANAYVYK